MKVCGGSECVLFEKCGPDFEPIFWPRFRGQKLGSAEIFKQQPGVRSRFRAHFPATIPGPLLGKICGPLTHNFARSDAIFARGQEGATAAIQSRSSAGTCRLPAARALSLQIYLKLLHASSDVVPGLRSLSEGPATADQR